MGLLVITRTNPDRLGAVHGGGLRGAGRRFTPCFQATLIAIIQILVYAGGIMVLVIFVIMLLNLHEEDLRPMKARAGTVTPGPSRGFWPCPGPGVFNRIPQGKLEMGGFDQ